MAVKLRSVRVLQKILEAACDDVKIKINLIVMGVVSNRRVNNRIEQIAERLGIAVKCEFQRSWWYRRRVTVSTEDFVNPQTALVFHQQLLREFK